MRTSHGATCLHRPDTSEDPHKLGGHSARKNFVKSASGRVRNASFLDADVLERSFKGFSQGLIGVACNECGYM